MIRKVLVISIPRSGSTFVHESLSHYILRDYKGNRAPLIDMWDEPFYYVNKNEKNSIEKIHTDIHNILQRDTWSVKHLIGQETLISKNLLTKLYRASDKVVILRRNHIDQILSLAVANKINRFDHTDITIELTEEEIKAACLMVASDRHRLDQCFSDKIVNYENLQYPRKVVSEILEIDINNINPFEIKLRKNYTNITNREECLHWINNYYEPIVN